MEFGERFLRGQYFPTEQEGYRNIGWVGRDNITFLHVSEIFGVKIWKGKNMAVRY